MRSPLTLAGPPKNKIPEIDEQRAEAFAAAAPTQTVTPATPKKTAPKKPWENVAVNGNHKLTTFRMRREIYQKLAWLAEKEDRSTNYFLEHVLEGALNQRIAKISESTSM